MKKEPITPYNKLTIVIRDDSPMVFCNDTPSYRSITINLTHEQREQIALNNTSHSGQIEYYESISQCFLEK